MTSGNVRARVVQRIPLVVPAPNLGKMSLRRRVVLVAALYFVLMGVGQVAGLAARARLERLEQERRELAPALLDAAAAQVSLLDERDAVLAFTLTGDERSLEPYERGRTEKTRALAALRAAIRKSPALAPHVDAVTRAAEVWQREAAEPALAAARARRRAEAAAIIAQKGMTLFDTARSEAERLSAAVSRELRVAQQAIDDGENLLATLMMLASTTGFVLTLGTIWLLRQWVTQPLTMLSTDVRRVADGGLSHGIRSSGPPELARLGRDVEAMRRRILAELDTAVRAVEGLQQSAPLVVGLRSELAGGLGSVPRGVTAAARFQPAEGVLAGDWYDLVQLDDDHVALVVVDISGHGAAAGLFALRIKHLLVPALRLGMGAGGALGWVADQLGDTGDQFATCLVVELGLSSGICRYANAGHPPGLVFGARGVKELRPTGPLLGPLKGTWATKTTRLTPRDLLVAYTDGLVEVRTARGDEFGVERLIEVVEDRRERSPESVADDLIEAVLAFSGRRPVDDLTLVALRRAPARTRSMRR